MAGAWPAWIGQGHLAEELMRRIDLETWPRASHYRFFRKVRQPHFGVTQPVDVTRLVEELKPAGVRPFNASLFCLVGAANDVPEFRTRFRVTPDGDDVVEHGAVGASFTVPIDDGRFAFCDVPFIDDWTAFDARCRETIEAARRQTGLVHGTGGTDNWVFMSCLPWLSFTGMFNPVDGPEDCVPRIAWGKFENTSGQWSMPVSVETHHALVDGMHLGRFFQAFESRLEALPG